MASRREEGGRNYLQENRSSPNAEKHAAWLESPSATGRRDRSPPLRRER